MSNQSAFVSRSDLLLAVLIAGLTLVAYSNSFQVPFVFDDVRSIVENPRIRDLNNYTEPRMLTRPRPLVELTFALNYHWHGLNLEGYHLVNLLIHICNGWLVYLLTLLIAQKLCAGFPHRFTALVAALFFTLHPLQTQAVTYIVQRYTSLAAFFYLAAVLLFIMGRTFQTRNVASNRSSRINIALCFGLTLLCGILAFLSKQHTASLPGAILLVEFILFDRTWAGWKRKLTWLIPALMLFLAAILYNVGFFSRSTGQGLLEDVSSLMQETDDISRSTYLYTQMRVIVLYLRLVILPVGQNLDYMYPFVSSFREGWTPLGFGILLLLAVAGIAAFKKYPILTLGIGWFFITLAVESSIIPIRDALFEHRMYLPLAGVAWIAGHAAGALYQHARQVALAGVLAVMLLLAGATFLRNQVWQSHISLWQDTVAKAPHNYRAHVNLAMAYEMQHEYDLAERHFARAFQRNPNYGYAHSNYGAFLEGQGRHAEALKHFKQTLKLRPDFAPAHNNMGAALASRGHLKSALPYFEQAIKLDRYFTSAYENLALTYEYLGQPDEAAEIFKLLLEIEPNNQPAHQKLLNLEGAE